MGRLAILAGSLGLAGAPALAQTACEPLTGDLFTRACLEERDRLANQALVERLAALCGDVERQLLGQGSAEWSLTESGGRCLVSVAAPGSGSGEGPGGRLSDVLGGGAVVGVGGTTAMELPPGFENFVEENGLVLVERNAFVATMEGLQIIKRAEEAGIPSQALDLEGIEGWTLSPDAALMEQALRVGPALEMDELDQGVIEGMDPGAMALDPGATMAGPGDGGG